MKLSVGLLFASALALTAQDSLTSLKHEAWVSEWMSASAISRDTTESVVHLKGNVEIKTPICVAQACSGYVVLRADQADFHMGSGAIEASGNVRVTREP